MSDGGWQNSPLADLIPVKLPESTRHLPSRFFQCQSLTAQGAQSVLCRLDENPARNAERWKKIPQMANYQEVGEAKPGATTLLQVPRPRASGPSRCW